MPYPSLKIFGAVVIAASLAACTGAGRWERADEFVAGLQCGMSADEITRYSQQFSDTVVYSPGASNLPDLVVEHRGTKVACWLDKNGLHSVEVSWISAPMKLTTEPKKEI